MPGRSDLDLIQAQQAVKGQWQSICTYFGLLFEYA